ncbi:hypothetical protein B0H12DRAFT_1090532 [Mycena haematopus]|nr:hypothetical protein B0H12DRAFT_1090532 [Mycena haematopus]
MGTPPPIWKPLLAALVLETRHATPQSGIYRLPRSPMPVVHDPESWPHRGEAVLSTERCDTGEGFSARLLTCHINQVSYN